LAKKKKRGRKVRTLAYKAKVVRGKRRGNATKEGEKNNRTGEVRVHGEGQSVHNSRRARQGVRVLNPGGGGGSFSTNIREKKKLPEQ